MKLWKVFLKKGNNFNVSYLIVDKDSLSNILDEIADTGCVSGDFYRVIRTRGESDGTNTTVVRFDKERIISMSIVEFVEQLEYDNVVSA